MAGEPLPSLSPTLGLGSVPAYPGTMPSLWLQKHKIPLIQSLFSTTSQGGEGRGARGGSLGGLSKPLMIWEVPDAKLRGCLASMCSAWIPHSSTDPRTVPLSAQVDSQLMGRNSQKAERGTKVETVAEGVSPRCPLSALHSFYKTLGKDAVLPLSSCLDRAWLHGASSEKGRQARRTHTGHSLESWLLPALVQGLVAMFSSRFLSHSHASFFSGPPGDWNQ